MSCKSSAEQTCLLCRGVADNRAKIYNCRTPTTSGEDWQFSNSIIRDENMMIAGGHKTRPYDFGGGVAFGLRGTSWRGDARKRRPLGEHRREQEAESSKQCSCTIVSNFERSENFYNIINFLVQAITSLSSYY